MLIQTPWLVLTCRFELKTIHNGKSFWVVLLDNGEVLLNIICCYKLVDGHFCTLMNFVHIS